MIITQPAYLCDSCASKLVKSYRMVPLSKQAHKNGADYPFIYGQCEKCGASANCYRYPKAPVDLRDEP